MVTLLRYLAGYWLVISAIVLVLYDWKIRHRFPHGSESLQFIILIPGVFFLIASFVISYRRRRLENKILKEMFPNGIPVAPSNRPFKMAEEDHSALNVAASARSPVPVAQTTTLAMEQAGDLLIASVLKNNRALQQAVLLLAKKDVSAADALSRILQASEAISQSGPDEPSRPS